MAEVIDMKLMRYLNVFEKVTRVSTRYCFLYNNTIIFAVPKSKVSKAVGKNGANVKKIGEIFRRKIKIIPLPNDKEEISEFVKNIVDPVTFNKVDIKNDEVVVNAGRQSKAALIGRGRIREKELEDILNTLFNIKKLRIM